MKDKESLAFKDMKLGKENEAVVKRALLCVLPFCREGSDLPPFLPVFVV